MDIKENEEVNQVKIIYKRKRTFRNRIGSKPMLKVKRIRIIEDSEEEDLEKEKNKLKDINNINKIKNEKKNPITKYSSLNPNLFYEEFINEYKCILCGLIPSFETAEEAICCGYLFCENCKKKFEKNKDRCPKCFISISKLKTRKVKKFNKIFYKSFKNFIIKCPYKCEWNGPWNDLESHLFKCDLSYRYCIYKLVGCDFVDQNKIVKEHENNNDKLHLELALKFIKDKNIMKKKLKFELGETCRIVCHPHTLKYLINRDAPWICDGDKLELGCENVDKILSKEKARYRCDICNFDLCDSCVEKYYLN